LKRIEKARANIIFLHKNFMISLSKFNELSVGQCGRNLIDLIIINQMFAANAWDHLRYINREQDLGLEGLRKAKQSYNPDHMVRKYELIPA